MKQQVVNFITGLGAKASYSGKNKMMYITEVKKKGKKTNKDMESVEAATLRTFGYGLPFTLKTNK